MYSNYGDYLCDVTANDGRRVHNGKLEMHDVKKKATILGLKTVKNYSFFPTHFAALILPCCRAHWEIFSASLNQSYKIEATVDI